MDPFGVFSGCRQKDPVVGAGLDEFALTLTREQHARVRRGSAVLGLVLACMLAAGAPARAEHPPETGKTALHPAAAPQRRSRTDIIVDGCAAACFGQHNQCRIQSKGGPGCDAALTACLRGCTKH